MIFGNKSDIKEFNDLSNFYSKINEIIATDSFISKKDYDSLTKSISKSYNDLVTMEEQNVLLAWCKQKRVDIKKLRMYLDFYKNVDSLVKKHNDEYIKNHLKTDKE